MRLVDWVTEGVCDMPVRAEVTRHTGVSREAVCVSRLPSRSPRGVESDVLETNGQSMIFVLPSFIANSFRWRNAWQRTSARALGSVKRGRAGWSEASDADTATPLVVHGETALTPERDGARDPVTCP